MPTRTNITAFRMDPELKPWDQQPGEPFLWYRRFLDFRDTPPSDRSVRGAWAKSWQREWVEEQPVSSDPLEPRPTPSDPPSGGPPPAFRNAVQKLQWRERATALDQDNLRKERHAWEERRKRSKAARTGLLDTLMGKLAPAIQALNLAPQALQAYDRAGNPIQAYDIEGKPLMHQPSVRELAGVLGMIAREARAEYNDEPTQRQEVAGSDGGPVNIRLVQQLLAKQDALARQAEPEEEWERQVVPPPDDFDPMEGIETRGAIIPSDDQPWETDTVADQAQGGWDAPDQADGPPSLV